MKVRRDEDVWKKKRRHSLAERLREKKKNTKY